MKVKKYEYCVYSGGFICLFDEKKKENGGEKTAENKKEKIIPLQGFMPVSKYNLNHHSLLIFVEW